MLESLRSLYNENIEDDVREPILSVEIGNYGTIGFLAPHPTFWKQLTIVRAGRINLE